ncbi:hypothetical protein [Chitinibacter sp. ZOR0017]|uniref:hypothetical protein n=1 Tax=Chitinibacter sp. ZOR0017 TaxID=1339254 RepID=UPI000646BB05|nr:hypothetical protein [Chitinibacter sp. ZOR0017]
MKQIILPAILATALIGCGNSQETEQLRNSLSDSQAQNQTLQNELNQFKAAKEPHEQKAMEAFYTTLRNTTTWDEFPDKPAIAGYEQAKRTLATIALVKGTMKEAAAKPETLQTFIGVLRTMEQAWPERFSEDGKKIHDVLWACRDAVMLSRLTLEGVSDSRTNDVVRLASIQTDAVSRCSMGLALMAKSEK